MTTSAIVTRGYGTFVTNFPAAVVSRGYLDDPTAVTAGVTGDTTILEAEIVDGGKQIIITLTNDTWAATLGADNAITDAFIAGFDSDGAEAGGWNNTVRDAALTFDDVTRTSATVVTVDLPAVAAYSVDANEEITITLDASTLVTSSSDITASPAINITAAAAADPGTGPTPDSKIGGAKAGRNVYELPGAARRRRREKEEEEFLEIIRIALPEIMKYLK